MDVMKSPRNSSNQRSDHVVNLGAIQRVDPCALDIIDHATQSALYKFNSLTHQWEKTEVEGPMFIYQRVDKPLYSMMIANRNSPSDFIEPLTGDIRLTKQSPYVFFCKPDGTINGLWFYAMADCERMFVIMDRLVNEKSDGVSPAPRAPHSSAHASHAPPPYQQTANVSRIPPELVRPTAVRAGEKLMPAMLQVLLNEQRVPTAEPPKQMYEYSGRGAGETRVLDEPTTLVLKGNSSHTSLAGLSTVSVQGSEPETLSEGERIDRGQLLTPSIIARQQVAAPPAPTASLTPTPLTRQQLGQALEHLIATDPDFLTRIHQAYIDSLNAAFRLA